jgi:5'-3' exonuclease
MQEYGTLENLLQNSDTVKQKVRRSKLVEFRDQARLSRVLVKLRDDISLDQMTLPEGIERASDLRMDLIDEDRILSFYDEMGFQEIRRRFEASLLKRRGGDPSHRWRRGTATSSSQRRTRATIPRPQDYEDVPF